MRFKKQTRAARLAYAAALVSFTPYASAVLTFGPPGNNYASNPATPTPGGVDQFEGDYNSFAGTTFLPRYMLGASHTVEGPTGQFTFNNGTSTTTTYNIQLVATLDDAAVWEIAPNDAANFSVYAPLYTGSSEVGSSIVDLGRGLARGSPVTGGWSWGGGQGPFSWGTNTVSAIDTNAQLGTTGEFGGDFLQYDFNNDPADPNESIVTTFDSGGGLFVNDGGVYKLAGVNSLADTVLDSSGNPLQNSLYDVYGYYTRNSNNQVVQITTHGPMSTYSTRLSSKSTFIGLADGTIPSSQAAANPISDDGQLTVYTNLTTGAITGGALVIVANNATMQIAPNSGNSEISSLITNPACALDITNNKIFINYGSASDPIASIAADIKLGYSNGQWNGNGIISSLAQGNPAYGVGYADSADPGNPAGLGSNQIEVMYTLLGDANLDGKVNGTDFNILAINFNTGGDSWDQGDFNYDGKVNGSDFNVLAANFNQGIGSSVASTEDAAALNSFAAANGFAADLPEPGVGIMILAAGVFGITRRNRLDLKRGSRLPPTGNSLLRRLFRQESR